MRRHEIVGVITEVGKNAEGHFALGDAAGVGCMVRACRECEQCHSGDDQYCTRIVFTYNGKDWGEGDVGTQGGYSNRIVLDHRCAARIRIQNMCALNLNIYMLCMVCSWLECCLTKCPTQRSSWMMGEPRSISTKMKQGGSWWIWQQTLQCPVLSLSCAMNLSSLLCLQIG